MEHIMLNPEKTGANQRQKRRVKIENRKMQIKAAIEIILMIRNNYAEGSSEWWAIETVLEELKND